MRAKRVWVTMSVIVAIVGGAGLGARVASALDGAATVSFPTPVVIGQTTVAASITLTNNSSDQTEVCNDIDENNPPPGSGFCYQDEGITLVPSCFVVIGVTDPFCASGGGEDPDVFAVSATAIGRTGTACDGTEFDVVEVEPVTGKLSFTPKAGAGAFVLLPPTSSCIIDFTFAVLKLPLDYDSSAAGYQTAQIVRFSQFPSVGESFDVFSGMDVTTVLVQPTISTTASPSITIGGQLTDTATVSGRVDPQTGATVEFRVYGPNDASCTTTPAFTSTVAYPLAGGPVTSGAFTPSAAGTYRWRAFYSGDAVNAPVAGACNAPNETAVVNPIVKADVSISTQASATITIGGQVTDAATVSGRVNPQAGATVTFRLYGPDDPTCTKDPAFTSTVPLPAATDAVSSESFTPTAPGIYRWRASYGGDANNNAVGAACNAPNETVLVVPAPTTVASTASAGLVVGSGPITDSATVLGRIEPRSPATISFHLYGPEDPTCSRPAVFESLDVAYPVAGGSVTSLGFVPMTAGTYQWRAFYSGDASNQPASGACSEPAERVVVDKATPVVTHTSTSEVFVGEELTETGVVNGLVNAEHNGVVDVLLFGPSTVVGSIQNDAACGGRPVHELRSVPYSAAGTPVLTNFRPTTSGIYGWRVSYSGDANNHAATSVCNVVNVRDRPAPIVLGPTLPRTGVDTGALIALALGTTLSGVVLVLVSVRRRRLT